MTENRHKALDLAKGREPSAAEISRAADEVGAQDAQWAFTQWALRERAKAKFTRAEEMLFTRDGLEMASHERLSQGIHRAGFPDGCRVGDLTVGIGGDLVWSSQACKAVGFETVAEHAECARHNLGVYGVEAAIHEQDCLVVPWAFEYAFADPARRSGGRRTLDPRAFSPPLEVLLSRMGHLKFGRVKLSPMLTDGFLDSLGPDRLFVSHESECKEVLVHVGTEERTAAHFRGVWSYNADLGEALPGEVPLEETVEAPLAYVYDADPAIIRSHGLGLYKMPGLGDSNGYLTDTRLKRHWWHTGFRVLWHGPYHSKDVRLALAGTGLAVDVVKSRGVDLDPRLIRSRLWAPNRRPAVLFLYRVGKQVRALLAERLG